MSSDIVTAFLYFFILSWWIFKLEFNSLDTEISLCRSNVSLRNFNSIILSKPSKSRPGLKIKFVLLY